MFLLIDEAVGILKEYISMENLFFIPFLIFTGNCMKKSKRIDDTLIPNILGILGILLCSLVSFSQNTPSTWIQWVLLITVSFGQGLCVTGVAIFINQWMKQNEKFKSMQTFDGKANASAAQDINICPACGQGIKKGEIR